MKITVIGAGNMGGAIAAGAVKKGLLKPEELTISDPRPDLAEKLKKEGFQVRYTTENKSAVKGADVIIVAVKPWLMEEVLGDISEAVDRENQVIVSIAAGVTFEQLGGYLANERFGGLGLYRVIPNTAITLGKSVTFIASYNTMPKQDSMVMDLLEAMGDVFVVNEGQMTAVTALASSGIAYAYKYIDAAVKGGEQMGISGDEALKIVLGTVKGAVAMLENNATQPQEEINKVTTPGGITLKGLEAMEKSGFSQAVIDGLLATK